MKNKHLLLIGLVALLLIAVSSIALASSDSSKPATTLAEMVRQATAQFKDVRKAEAAGYALLHGCVSGPQDGAMGIHFANGALVGDGALDAMHPEALLYEPKDGKLQLVGVEYVVIADGWNATHQMPPVLMGQLFNYVGAPNRYGLPAFYELHVWAWKSNPSGVFADWNERVSCEEYVGDTTMHGSDR
ncbi:MAG TPA: hypothetical protein VGJ87_19550 [Roseiflexaceae bacterium]|jgi:hypothetical protein